MRLIITTIIVGVLFVTPSQGQEFCTDLCPGSCTLTATDALGVLNTAVGLNPANCSSSTTTTSTTLSSACPTEWPTPGDACEDNGKDCEYGEECCCDQCYDSYVCQCEGGEFECYYSDACLIPYCSTSTTSTTMSTTSTTTLP